MASILSSFFIFVPMKEFARRAMRHPLPSLVALIGILAPHLGRYLSPLVWEHMVWTEAELIHALALYSGPRKLDHRLSY